MSSFHKANLKSYAGLGTGVSSKEGRKQLAGWLFDISNQSRGQDCAIGSRKLWVKVDRMVKHVFGRCYKIHSGGQWLFCHMKEV
jgi:hypothetical protein